MKWTTQKRKINDLIPYVKNPRQMTEVQVKNLTESLEKFDLAEIPAIDTDNVIIAGHQRLKIMQLLGRGEEEIDVRIPDRKLTEEEFREYNIRSNKNTGEWDWDILANNYDEKELTEWGFTSNELDKYIFESREDDFDAEAEYEKIKEPKVKLGDLYQLGEHRLLCGDSTKKEDVERLMGGVKADLIITDPPYNTGMDEKQDKKARLSYMFKDKFSADDYISLLQNSFKNSFDFSKGECAFYVFIDWRNMPLIKQELENLMVVKNILVWDKIVHGLGSDYKFTYEMCVVGKKGKPKINNRYGQDYQDIWRVQRKIGRDIEHSTKKPIELLNKPILHASKQDDTVLDLFGGSGSTLIACEQLNRKCYTMELDPKFVDVIIKRYEQFTGDKAELILSSKAGSNGKSNG